MKNMNQREAQIHQIEMSLEEAKANIELAEVLDRLHKNKDFQAIIVAGYFKDEASRAVLLKGDPEMMADSEQKQIGLIIDGIGALRQYFHKIFAMGQMSHNTLVADEATRTELLAEELSASSGELVQ